MENDDKMKQNRQHRYDREQGNVSQIARIHVDPIVRHSRAKRLLKTEYWVIGDLFIFNL